MTVDLSLGDLFLQTFGYNSEAFAPKFESPNAVYAADTAADNFKVGNVVGNRKGQRLEQGSVGNGSPYYAVAPNGVEVFMPLTFKFLKYADLNTPTGTVGTQAATQLMLPYCVVSAMAKKHIIETPLTERRGTVKELINIEDFRINIKGFLIAATNDFPEGDVKALRDLFEVNASIELACPFTDILLLRPDRTGSDKVVISSLSFPEVRGVKNVKAFELECVSDEDFSLVDIS